MKKILKVRISNEFAEGPEVAVVEIDDHLRSRVWQLASAVKSLNVYAIREFNGYPEFFMQDHEHEESVIPRPPEDGFEEMACRVECVTLNVTDSDFYWTGYVKHTDVRFETDSIPLEEIE